LSNKKKRKQIIIAVPVASDETMVGKVIHPLVPEQFDAVGKWDQYFSPITDQQVIELLKDFR